MVITFQQERIVSKYNWTSLPWGQKKVAIVERLKQESMYGLSAKKKKMAIVDG